MTDTATFIINQGDSWVQQLILQNDDGSLMNLTGCQVHMQVRAFVGSPVVLLDLSTASGSITLNGAAAQINWNVPGTQTATFQPQPGVTPLSQMNPGTAPWGYYDLRIQFPSGEIVTYLSGQILLQLGITIPF
ncbi:hypothetical protein AB4Y32_15850 [Paraburkholderia phymatum]|uniref:Uncharacterized protein n=1 Tax=Paraburkholderia phymatum TaxID=148447 RepID=A0ACC6U0V9_9BURK